MSDNDDLFARALAEEDQAHAGIRDYASRLAAMRVQLIVGGFDKDETFELVRDYSNVLLAHTFATRGEQ